MAPETGDRAELSVLQRLRLEVVAAQVVWQAVTDTSALRL
jgi:hypothetical protein